MNFLQPRPWVKKKKKKHTFTLKRGEADGPKTENKIDGSQNLSKLTQLEAHQEEN